MTSKDDRQTPDNSAAEALLLDKRCICETIPKMRERRAFFAAIAGKYPSMDAFVRDNGHWLDMVGVELTAGETRLTLHLQLDGYERKMRNRISISTTARGITGSLTSANAWKSPTTCIFPMPNWRRGACGASRSMAIRPTTEAILTANRIIFTRNRRSGSKCASLSTTRASREANSENTSGERTASRLLWRRGRPSIAGNGAVTAPKGCAIIVRTGESSG